jgi:ABC-type sulfate transport system substrate-binding protein
VRSHHSRGDQRHQHIHLRKAVAAGEFPQYQYEHNGSDADAESITAGCAALRDRQPEAQQYVLDFLYTDAAQEAIAKYGYRPINPAILKKHSSQFPKIDLFPVTILAKDWDDARQKFFADNGVFDVIYKPKAQ